MEIQSINSRPPIAIESTEKLRLQRLAESALSHMPDVAEELLSELDRAVTVDPAPPEVVKMGSTVSFETDMGVVHKLQLVYPADADILEGRISILTPIGTALIGLSAGQSIQWRARDGRTRELTVSSVEQPGS
jgi:regulator of nucleoside diphosphate kinase